MLKMLKSPCICTTFSRFNIFDEKMLKKLEMLKFSIFLYKKLSPAAPVTPPYSMYYIFRFWGKLKSLRKYMHFNIFERSNIFNIFLTFSIQILTFPFNNFFSAISKKKWSVAVLHHFHRQSWADHGQIMGRSWADHGRSIHAENSWKFQLFPIPFFPKSYANLRFSHSPWAKRQVIFADPVSITSTGTSTRQQ